MGPLEMMYGWQALLCATACVGITKLVKTSLGITMGKKAMKASRWISTVLLPVLPIVVGALYAAFVPLRPEILLEYVAENVDGWALSTLAFAGWGAACGQFSTMLHQKLKDFLTHSKPE